MKSTIGRKLAFFNTYMYPDLPLHEGERVVSIINWDTGRRIDDQRVLLRSE
jgi:hypothetical protein